MVRALGLQPRSAGENGHHSPVSGLAALAGAPTGTTLEGKAFGLRWLLDNGFRVPPTWILQPSPDASETAEWLRTIVHPDRSYAVRSSANVEDGGPVSYAGQFASVLDARGLESVTAAVTEVLASADGAGVAAYRRHQEDERGVTMAVIVQEMVHPVVSGVAFSKNPITGLNETVIEAVRGSGDRLQEEGVTPARWIHRWGDIVERPDNEILDDTLVEEIVGEVARIAELMDAPVDTEWVYDGSAVWWVQVRGIGGLEDVTIYSRRIAKEVLPGLIKPLVWSINVPMVNAAWLDLLEDAVGELDLEPEDLARSFGYRAYFNMSAIGDVFEALGMSRESLELLLGLPSGSQQPAFAPGPGTLAKMPRLAAMATRLTRYGREVDRELPILDAVFRYFADRDLPVLDTEELIADVEALRRIGVEAARMNVITPLLANAYAALLRRRLAAYGIDAADIDISAGHGAAFDPNPALGELGARLATAGVATDGRDPPGYDDLTVDQRHHVDRFLRRFGHFSDSGNDFSVPAWRDRPDTVVRMALTVSEHAVRSESMAPADVESQIPAAARPIIRRLAGRAAAFGRRRDEVSSTYTFGYGLFRDYLLEVGERLTRSRAIADPDDVMFLTIDEVYGALRTPIDRTGDVRDRRAAMEEAEEYDMPDLIYGDDFVPSRRIDSDRRSWTGTPTARGYHRGPARIVHGIEDLDRVHEGDVLVIPFSDVGWTPLFSRAGAVVAESGGMLSHSSIVAREYRLPCVVSVSGAMQIPDGSTIIVDGYRGTVTMEEQE